MATVASASPPFNDPTSALANGTSAGYALTQPRLGGAKMNIPQDSTLPYLSRAGRPRRKQESLASSLRSWLFDHQIGICANLLILHALAHALLPRARDITRPFFQLSYYDPALGLYRRGPDDLYLVAYWAVAWTGLRAACMSWLLHPLARLSGVKKTKTQLRFAEQGWLIVYYTYSTVLGLYIMWGSKYWWFNFSELWTDFPVLGLSAVFKWYYLSQFAFWLQQILVIHLEERRKDHWQMLTHHIVTSLLVCFSYGYYQTAAGNVILCLMDSVDIVLSLAKNLKYAGYQLLCDVMFGIFILSWFALRHVVYLVVCWSVYLDLPREMEHGCYSSSTGQFLRPIPDGSDEPGGNHILKEVTKPYWDPAGEICFNYRIQWTFLFLLGALQVITIMWFCLILRVAYRVLKGGGADDSRSDSEDSDKEEEEEEELDEEEKAIFIAPAENAELSHCQPVEEYVGVEGLTFTRKGSSAAVRSRKPGASSGLATISDKKDILNRIGCDTKSS